MSYDWMHIYGLLQVVKETQGHPNLKNIGVAAMAELNAIANPPMEPEEPEEEPELGQSESTRGPLSSEPPIGDAPNGRRV